MFFRLSTLGLTMTLGLVARAIEAQRPSSFKPEVREYISVDAPTVALTHVQVIDGTGSAPKTDQTIVLAGDKIQAVGPAAPRLAMGYPSSPRIDAIFQARCSYPAR